MDNATVNTSVSKVQNILLFNSCTTSLLSSPWQVMVVYVNVYVYWSCICICWIYTSVWYNSSTLHQYVNIHAFMLVKMRAGVFMCLSVVFIDLDECVEELHLCQQVCQNTLGSYRCSCSPGFQLSSDGTSCSGEWISVCCVLMHCQCQKSFLKG